MNICSVNAHLHICREESRRRQNHGAGGAILSWKIEFTREEASMKGCIAQVGWG